MKNNYKFHKASDQLADLAQENDSCSELTPKLKDYGLFDWKHEEDGSLSFMFKHQVRGRLVPVNDFQGAVEANSSIGLLALRELLTNADEANLELDHFAYDPKDYSNLMNSKTYNTIYADISSMKEAHQKFGNSQDHLSRRTILALMGGSARFKKLHIQDMGCGRCGDDFASALGLAGGKPSMKGIVPWNIGKYNLGQKAITATQDPKTLRYRGAISKPHPDLTDEYTEFPDHWNLSLCLILADDHFRKGEILEDTTPIRTNSTYTLYRIEFQKDDGTWSHPICSKDYKYNPKFRNDDTYKDFENATHGTTIFVFDSNLHKNVSKVCNVEDSEGLYEKISALSTAVSNIHPKYIYPIVVVDRDGERDDGNGGDTSSAHGFEAKLDKKMYRLETIELGAMEIDLFNRGNKTKIPVFAYYRADALGKKQKLVNEGKSEFQIAKDMKYVKNCSHGGTGYKVNDYYAQFDPARGNHHKYGFPNGLHNYIRIVIDFNNASYSERKELTKSRRDSMELDSSVADAIESNVKRMLQEHERIKEIISDWGSKEDQYNSHEILNLFSSPFLKSGDPKGCKPINSDGGGLGMVSDPSMIYQDRMSWLKINDRTLTIKKFTDPTGSMVESKMKHVGENSSSYNLDFRHDAKNDVVSKNGLKITISQSFDNGDTWSKHPDFYERCIDGQIAIKNISVPDKSELNEDKRFLTKVDFHFENADTWVSEALLNSHLSHIIDCFVEPKEVIVRTNASHNRVPANQSNQKSGLSQSSECPLKVNLIEELESLKSEDGEYKYIISSDSDSSHPMREQDLVGMSKEGSYYIIALNAVSTKYRRVREVVESFEHEKYDHYMRELLSDKITQLIANSKDHEITDLSAINNSFESDLKSIAHTWNQSCKKFFDAGVKRFNQIKLKEESKNKRKAKSKKLISKKKPLAKKKSKQSSQ